MLSSVRGFLFIFLLTSFACESAERSTQATDTLPRGESALLESCGSTSDCSESLRCLEQRCLTGVRSRLGDLHAAAGRRAQAAGETEASAMAYESASAAYEKEGIAMPLELLCHQGMALAEARADAQRAEAAARILHRCVLAAPASSQVTNSAMLALASLVESGLDEELIARSEPADRYLTKQPSGPDLSKVKVVVGTDSKSSKRTFIQFMDALRDDGSTASFKTCWQDSWNKHKQKQLDVPLDVSYKFFLDPDDESRDRAQITVEGDGVGGAACVNSVVAKVAETQAKKMRQDTRWKYKIRVQIGE